MGSSKTQIGVIGIGFGQHVLVPAFGRHSNCEVTAICASTAERAQAAAMRLGIHKAYGNWRALLEDRSVDAVAIATPPRVQTEVAVAALNSGKAVFCEKPLAVSLSAAATMSEAAARSGLANMVDFEFPEIPLWQQAKAILDAGGVGKVRHLVVNWNVEIYSIKMGLSSWKTVRPEGGGALFSFVSHVFYYLEWLLGPIGRLSCTLFSTARSADGTLAEASDTVVTLVLESQSGVPVSVSVSTAAFLGTGHRIEVYGAAGTLLLLNESADYVSGFRLFHGTREKNSLHEVAPVPDSNQLGSDGRVSAVSRLAGRFLDWTQNLQPSCPSFQDGLRVQRLLENSLISHQTGKWIPC